MSLLPVILGVDGLALNIENLVDISSTMNKELSMRIKTSVANSGGEYFTDLNAFQVCVAINLLSNMLIQKIYDETP